MKKLHFRSIFFTCGLLLLLTGCSGTEKPVDRNDRTGRDVRKEPIVVMPSTALTVIPWNAYPQPFYSDSVFKAYQMTFTSADGNQEATGDIHAWFPQSADPDHAGFNQEIRKLVSDFITAYEPEQNVNYLYMSAAIWAMQFERKGNLVHTGFLYQSFHEGAAHYNHGQSALNYDLAKKKKVVLPDVLNFEDEREKQIFCDAYMDSCSPDIRITPADLSASRDFRIAADGIYLYFGEGEKDSGMLTHFIPVEKFQSFIGPGCIDYFQ